MRGPLPDNLASSALTKVISRYLPIAMGLAQPEDLARGCAYPHNLDLFPCGHGTLFTAHLLARQRLGSQPRLFRVEPSHGPMHHSALRVGDRADRINVTEHSRPG